MRLNRPVRSILFSEEFAGVRRAPGEAALETREAEPSASETSNESGTERAWPCRCVRARLRVISRVDRRPKKVRFAPKLPNRQIRLEFGLRLTWRAAFVSATSRTSVQSDERGKET
jgi:hypothetical protein